MTILSYDRTFRPYSSNTQSEGFRGHKIALIESHGQPDSHNGLVLEMATIAQRAHKGRIGLCILQHKPPFDGPGILDARMQPKFAECNRSKEHEESRPVVSFQSGRMNKAWRGSQGF